MPKIWLVAESFVRLKFCQLGILAAEILSNKVVRCPPVFLLCYDRGDARALFALFIIKVLICFKFAAAVLYMTVYL